MALALNLKSRGDRALYDAYMKLKRNGEPAWSSPDEFYRWAKAQGYREGCRLMRRDRSKPLSPDNFLIHETIPSTKSRKCAAWGESIKRWDATVKQLRAAFGLPPLKDLED